MGYIQRKRSRFGEIRSSAETLERAARYCKQGIASYCREYDRLTTSTAQSQMRVETPEELAQMAVERDRHYAERQGGITRGLTNVSQAGFIDARIAEASRTGQDIEYGSDDRVVRIRPAESDSGWDWGAIGGFFTDILGAAAPVAGKLYTQRTQAQLQQDMLKRAIQPKRRQAPQTIIIPKKSNTNLYIGLGVTAAAMMMILGVVVIKKKRRRKDLNSVYTKI